MKRLTLIFGIISLIRAYNIDIDSEIGRIFDGIGGLSGGGVRNISFLISLLNVTNR